MMPEPFQRQFADVIECGLIGSPETIRQRIAAYEAVGVQEVRLAFPDAVKPGGDSTLRQRIHR